MTDNRVELLSGPILHVEWSLSASYSDLDTEMTLVLRYLQILTRQRSALTRRRNTLVSPFLRLPPELMHIIFSTIAARPSNNDLTHPSSGLLDLRACQLTCTSFLPYTRAQLLPVLQMDGLHDWMRALWLRRHAQALWTHPRTLRIRDEPPIPEVRLRPAFLHEMDAGRLPMLPQLESPKPRYTVREADFSAFAELFSPPDAPRFPRVVVYATCYSPEEKSAHRSITGLELETPKYTAMFTHTTELVLCGSAFHGVGILRRVLYSFPHLESLELDACGLAGGNDTANIDDGPLFGPLGLRHLSVTKGGNHLTRSYSVNHRNCVLLYCLLRWNAPNLLRSVSVDVWSNNSQDTDIEGALAHAASRVETLGVKWDYDPYTPTDADFSRFEHFCGA